MGRTCRNCPVFGCGSTNLARLANHLDQVHRMDTEERAKWLKWSKLGICVPLEDEETRADNKELNMEKTLERLIKRQEDMETNFNTFLRARPGKQNTSKLSTKKEQRFRDTDKKDIAKKWLTL